MTVAELKDHLSQFPDDAVIFIETTSEIWVAQYVDRDIFSPGAIAVIIGSEETFQEEESDVDGEDKVNEG